MNSIHEILISCIYSFRKRLTDLRFYIVLSVTAILMVILTDTMKDFVLNAQSNINILEPFLLEFQNDAVMTILYLGLIMIFTDAPFFDEKDSYFAVRIQRINWFLGKCIYVVFMTVLYILFLELISILCILPVGYIGNMWSEAIYLLSTTNAAVVEGVPLVYSTNVIWALTMNGAAFHNFFLSVLGGIFLGMLFYLLSIKTNKVFGIISVSAIFFSGKVIIWTQSRELFKVAFYNIVNLTKHDFGLDSSLPTLSWSYMILAILNAILILSIVCSSRKDIKMGQIE